MTAGLRWFVELTGGGAAGEPAIALDSDSQTGAILPHPSSPRGNVWGHFWLLQMEGEQYHWHWMVEARDAAAHPTMHRAGSPAKNYLAENVSSAKTEKSCLWT